MVLRRGEWHSVAFGAAARQRGARGAGAGASVHSPLTRAGRAPLKVGAPPEGR